MFRTILVPLDGTPFAEAALPLATRLGRPSRARVRLLMAHQPAAVVAGLGGLPTPDAGIDLDARAREETYLGSVADSLRTADGVPVELRHPDGPPGMAVCDEVRQDRPDLVVMATHGRGALGRFWLGSVAHHVIRQVDVPVLLVHPRRTGEPPDLPAHPGILVPLDLSPFAERVLEPVAVLSRALGAHLELLHVVELGPAVSEPMVVNLIPEDPVLTEVRRTDALRRLEDIATRLRARGLTVSTHVVVGSSAAAGVIDALSERRCDMVAMSTHGAGGMRRLFLGSVADKVVRASARPVLVVRPAQLPGE
ncbi:MAG TPA: universal stress protein [Gemmatimonadales bacterium]|nr:universal stress protein [Gemmatimonadales bacterium]